MWKISRIILIASAVICVNMCPVLGWLGLKESSEQSRSVYVGLLDFLCGLAIVPQSCLQGMAKNILALLVSSGQLNMSLVLQSRNLDIDCMFSNVLFCKEFSHVFGLRRIGGDARSCTDCSMVWARFSTPTARKHINTFSRNARPAKA